MGDSNPTPEVGQVWADNDERTVGAGEFRILAIGHIEAPGYATVRRADGSVTRIRVDRFADTSGRGYHYIGRTR